ncbi:MAG: hypothetical protein Q8O94_02880 [bacterium]|nr:hypothetical protein [bacterium]
MAWILTLELAYPDDVEDATESRGDNDDAAADAGDNDGDDEIDEHDDDLAADIVFAEAVIEDEAVGASILAAIGDLGAGIYDVIGGIFDPSEVVYAATFPSVLRVGSDCGMIEASREFPSLADLLNDGGKAFYGDNPLLDDGEFSGDFIRATQRAYTEAWAKFYGENGAWTQPD